MQLTRAELHELITPDSDDPFVQCDIRSLSNIPGTLREIELGWYEDGSFFLSVGNPERGDAGTSTIDLRHCPRLVRRYRESGELAERVEQFVQGRMRQVEEARRLLS